MDIILLVSVCSIILFDPTQAKWNKHGDITRKRRGVYIVLYVCVCSIILFDPTHVKWNKHGHITRKRRGMVICMFIQIVPLLMTAFYYVCKANEDVMCL